MCVVLCTYTCTRTYTHTHTHIASFPGLYAQLLLLTVWKAGEGLDGFITWCMPLLTSRSVCSHLGLFSPLHFFPWIEFVLSVQFVLWVWLLLVRSWLATVRDISRPSPRFLYCKRQKLGVEAWERGYTHTHTYMHSSHKRTLHTHMHTHTFTCTAHTHTHCTNTCTHMHSSHTHCTQHAHCTHTAHAHCLPPHTHTQ